MTSKGKALVVLLLAAMNLFLPMAISFLSYVLTETSTFNLFWGVSLGFGYEGMAGITGSISNKATLIVGGIVWPLLFFIAVTCFEGWLLARTSGRLATYLWIMFVAINLINFPVSKEEGSLYQKLPIYSKMQCVAY